MRMSTAETRDEELSIATITAAAEAGVAVFDTARAYAPDPAQLGHNERLLAQALRRCGTRVRVVTKGGMTRAGGGWIPDGRAKAIRADCEASLMALDGLEIDLYLLHAPDPRTPWRTSVRALGRLVEEGLVRRVGLSNVNRAQLDEACELAPVAVAQVALSVFDDRALRGGVLDRCAELGISVIAHSPLGGPRRAGSLARQPALAEVARQKGATAAELALAWLLELSPTLIAIPGARRPETARWAARAGSLVLDAEDRATIAGAYGGSRAERGARSTPTAATDLVIVMGIPGAGKSRLAKDYADRGYVRLNRDERGGSLRDLANALDEQLSSGGRDVVLDNTYVSRAARSYVIDAARRHAVSARCLWLDTPLHQAQVNLVERILERFGRLPSPEELRALARREPELLMPTSQMRALRELEAPSTDEGFTSVERLPFTRAASSRPPRGSVLVGARALETPGWERALAAADPSAPHLIFDWRPEASPGDLEAAAAQVAIEVSGPVEIAVCPHPAGPPSCWCRPPLPGLPLAFARAHDLDLSRATLIGASATHRTMARTLGARCVLVG
jgi:aryl-alcohol dehydrogenase-like predicted oxidoreductase/adenylate kinase family enzyme